MESLMPVHYPRFASLCRDQYYKNDPPERRWRERDGLVGLFDLARQHVTCEYIWR